jgi:hypothetical protein
LRVYKFLDAHFGLKSLYERRLKISRIDELNDPFELLPYEHSDNNLRQAFLKTRDDVGSERGVVCFSLAWSDPVIWAHYSDKHRGLSLGFDIPEIKKSPEEDETMFVNYENKPMPFPNDYEGLTSEQSSVVVQKVLSTKFENWKYEREIRVWLPLQNEEAGLHFLNFGEKLLLKEVILGAKCTLPTVGIERALGLSVSEVTVIKARAAHDAFQMVADEESH